ncbi:TetR/AcrR family transcriptional regulator [Brevundimonas sp. DC300-4]|uniref:TetR/AcrR family transcriptional regulator n=1 Tax=unclassified Brevundimonas TaxID=2622653 RepID=UPI003CF954B9
MKTTDIENQRPSARGRKSAKKRDEIIRAATEVINDKTFALATMIDIAARLDLRDATLYYYFPNKQALAYACHIRSLERFDALLSSADAETVSGVAKLRNLIRGLIDDSVRDGPQLYFGDYSYLEPFQQEEIASFAKRMTVTLERFVQEGMKDGSIVNCDPQLVVQLLLGMLIWLARWTSDINGLTPDKLMDAIETFSFRGLARS